MLKRTVVLPVLLVLASCDVFDVPDTSRVFRARVSSSLAPAEASIPDKYGDPMPAAASRDASGIQSDFLEGVLIITPRDDAELRAFLDRYGGTVMSDDAIPEPPSEMGMTLTAEQRRATAYTVRISLGLVNEENLAANAAAAGLTGLMEFSSESGMLTFAGAVDALAAGFRVSGDFISYGNQAFPFPMFNSNERVTGPAPGTATDPFTNAAYADFGATGNASNVRLAWQFVAAHGIQRRTRVAIIDSGFYVDGAGLARGTDSDFPLPPARPLQHDIDFEDPFAGDPGPMNCGPGNPCWWHGTGSAGVATGIANNRLGGMGTGGQVADPILLRVNGTKDQRNLAIRTAVAWGADVVSMSFGSDCNVWCRMADRDENPFDDAVNGGSKAVFVSSAGNGRGNPGAGYDVGDPSFYHPCIEDHVICVGALNPGTNARISYSNFGAQVDLFAPTNIPVMSYPNSFSFDALGNATPLPLSQADGPAVPQVFTGTSASAPFVAGVAAMIKAINPDLNHDDVARILIETATPGASPQVTRTLNAYAAVQRAAEGINVVKDTLENNDLVEQPTDLGDFANYSQRNLNIDARDRDYYKFISPAGSLMTLNLMYPQGLGDISVFSLESFSGECGRPRFVSETPLAAGGKSLVYEVPGGPLELGLRAQGVNAYNMTITFASATYDIDGYESNNTPATARHIFSIKPVASGNVRYGGKEARVTINATIHAGSDVDYYLVRGARLTGAERILLVGHASLKVYGNDSALNLQVFRRNADGSPGAAVANLNAGDCVKEALEVALDEDAYYIVRVSGSPGRYTLQNGVSGSVRRIPILVRDQIYEVLHPGDPIERVIRYPEVYVVVVDGAYSQVRTPTPGLDLRLYDFDGNAVAFGDTIEGAAGRRLSLAATTIGQVYSLHVTPDEGAEAILRLEWDAAEPVSVGENLIVNGGAEIVAGDDNDDFVGWDVVDALNAPRLYFYDDQAANPSPSGPGPAARGEHLFAGGDNNEVSGLTQTIFVEPSWQQAIETGRVRARFVGFLGGNGAQADAATAKATFVNANLQPLGEITLSSVTAEDRENQTGLLPVAGDDIVPAGTYAIRVELSFAGNEGGFNDGYADELELTLSELPAAP